MSEQKTIVFGIDLGTAYSCIAYMDEYNRATVVTNAEGDRTTPSVVQFDGPNRIVGKEAKNNSALYPENTVETIKYHMGKSDYVFVYQDMKYTPEEISSYILRKVVQDAEQATGLTIHDVVITCPAYFGIAEREATARAGEIAGLNVRSIINEPTAAAIAFGVNQQDDQTVLVYDLGGGTFDVTVINIQQGAITVICTDGDHYLGGKNWDKEILNHFVEKWQAETGSTENPLESPETYQDWMLRAEAAKHALTQKEKTEAGLAHNGQRVRVALTREQFDQITDSLLQRTIAVTQQVLAEAGRRGYTTMHQILLVGGSTRMPQVANAIRSAFQLEPKIFDPDEAVAKGAAIYGQKLALNEEIVIRVAEATGVAPDAVNIDTVDAKVIQKVQEAVARDFGLQIGAVKKAATTKITNVVSRSFGVIAIDKQQNRQIVFNLIIRNTSLPTTNTQRFGTLEANQTSVLLEIVENLSSDSHYEVDASRKLGEAVLVIPPKQPANSPFDLTFELNAEGRLDARGRDLIGGNEAEVVIQLDEGATKEEIAEAISRSQGIVIS